MDNQTPDADAQTPAHSEPVSQREDVHNDVAAAIQQLKGKTEPGPEAPPVDDQPAPIEAKADHPNDPNRYADGTFKPTKTEAAPDKAAPVDPKSASTDTTTKASAPAPTPGDAPPAGWTPDAKAEWSNLSPALKAAVLKRENEIAEGGRQWSEEKRRYQATLAPLVQETQRLGIAPEQGLNALLQAHHMLTRDPASAIAELAQRYGVDLANLASNPPAPQAQSRFDPMVSHLTQTVSALESQLNGFLQNQTLGIVERFAQDKPHYAAVENDIARLIPVIQQAHPGLSPSDVLEKAYEQAIWVNPDVRAQLIADERAKQEQQQAEALKAKAAQAAKAAVSIKGSSNGARTAPKIDPTIADETPYDTVRRTIAELRQ